MVDTYLSPDYVARIGPIGDYGLDQGAQAQLTPQDLCELVASLKEWAPAIIGFDPENEGLLEHYVEHFTAIAASLAGRTQAGLVHYYALALVRTVFLSKCPEHNGGCSRCGTTRSAGGLPSARDSGC